MTFDTWFGAVVKKHYSNAKNFSDQEKFPLPCVYRWIRGACLPRPIQISLICRIVAKKEFDQYLEKNKKEDDTIIFDFIYSDICSDVMVLLEKDLRKKKNENLA